MLHPAPATLDRHGTVEALAIAPAAEGDTRLLNVAQAPAGRGLDGDRYTAGPFSPRAEHRPAYDLTLLHLKQLSEPGLLRPLIHR